MSKDPPKWCLNTVFVYLHAHSVCARMSEIREITIYYLAAETLMGDILWRPAVLYANKKASSRMLWVARERDFVKFLNEYIQDIA